MVMDSPLARAYYGAESSREMPAPETGQWPNTLKLPALQDGLLATSMTRQKLPRYSLSFFSLPRPSALFTPFYPLLLLFLSPWSCCGLQSDMELKGLGHEVRG